MTKIDDDLRARLSAADENSSLTLNPDKAFLHSSLQLSKVRKAGLALW